MRKAINFDIDTKKYEQYTGKDAPLAYTEIKAYFERYGFEHRQGSGYISKDNVSDRKIAQIITSMPLEIEWLDQCIKVMDVTDIGKQHSVTEMIHKVQTKKIHLRNKINSLTHKTFSPKVHDDYER